TTRTVTEASATVKGLTGIDVPALIGTSMGARFGGTDATPPKGPTGGGAGGSGGSGGGGRSGGDGGGGGGAKPTAGRPRREPPTSSRAMADPPAAELQAAATASAATASAAAPASEQAQPDPGAAMSAAVSELDRSADRARQAVDRAIGQPTPARGTSGTSGTSPALGGLERESTLDEAASALADDLMRIPGIQRFGDMRLGDLDAAGPRPLRTMWRVARDRLASRYGEMTIGEIIDRYRGGDGGVSAGA
ncbi:MAG TPA: hypothetical protein VMQ65_07800, partial [Candidatus Limnocylindria bacterium]|nr:hypothetical protein [Candidatus Limnocylindria bacterium]